MTDGRVRSLGAAFLLSQLGGHSSREWTRRLAAIGMEPREVMLFRFVALNEGRSQAELARAVGLPASRIVGLLDRLQTRGWVERRTSAGDRRTNRLHVTDEGRAMLARIMMVSAEHEEALTRGLSASDRQALVGLLSCVAHDQGLIEGVHPGFADTAADQSHDDPTEQPAGDAADQ